MNRSGSAPLSEFCLDWLNGNQPLVYGELLEQHATTADFQLVAAKDELVLIFRHLQPGLMPPEVAAAFHEKLVGGGVSVLIPCPAHLSELFFDLDPVSRAKHVKLRNEYNHWAAGRAAAAAGPVPAVGPAETSDGSE